MTRSGSLCSPRACADFRARTCRHPWTVSSSVADQLLADCVVAVLSDYIDFHGSLESRTLHHRHGAVARQPERSGLRADLARIQLFQVLVPSVPG